MAATCRTMAGVFETREAAERAVAALRAARYRDDQIGVVARTPGGRVVREGGGGGGDPVAAGAAVGAAVGAGAAALGSLAVSFGVIPVIGPVLAVGPLAAALISAAGGAAAGGLAGTLVGLGLSEEDARYYEGEVNAGKYLVTVECGYGDDARDILARHGGHTRPTAG